MSGNDHPTPPSSRPAHRLLRPLPCRCLNVYSFNVSEACDQIAYIGSLPGQQTPGVVLELGNELYIANQGDPKFPTSQAYAEQMVPIVACARKHMPHAKVAAVGAPGRWNQGLKKRASLFDAVSWHAYEPAGREVNAGGRNPFHHLEDRVSFVAGYGRAATQNALAEAKASLGVAKPLVHSEFGYGLDRPGQCVLDTAMRGVNGALHGAFHVSRIIEGINTQGTFAALTLEGFVGGALGAPLPVDPQAGNRTDNWCGLAVTTVPTATPNRPDLARVAGTGQVFSHVAAAALRSEATLMHPVAVDGGPELPFPILGAPHQPCLQAAAFSEPAAGDARGNALTLAVLNICRNTTTTQVQMGPGNANAEARASVYSLFDSGPAGSDGWAPLPPDPDALPWASGPLKPTSSRPKADASGQLAMDLPGLSFTVLETSQSSRHVAKTDDASIGRAPPALPGEGRWEVSLHDDFASGFNSTLWTKGWSWCNGTGQIPGTPQPRVQTKASDTCFFGDDNVAVVDGKLVLTNRRERSHGFDYTSGVVNSIAYPGRGFQQTYGYFEARILPSAGKHNLGMCPAFWLPNVRNNGDDGNCEIDVMEIPGNPKFGGGHTVWGTVHATHDSYANGSAHGAPRISPRESLHQVLCSKSVYVFRERHFQRFLER